MTVKLTRFEQDASTHDLGGGNSSRGKFASPAGTKMGYLVKTVRKSQSTNGTTGSYRKELEAVYMRGERKFNGSEHSFRYEMLSIYMRFYFGLNS